MSSPCCTVKPAPQVKDLDALTAVYAALAVRGIIPREQLDTYCGEGSLLGVHPEHVLPGIDFSTGSLGHGLTFGVGAALAARLQRSPRRTFVLVSDAECNEGSVWEAVMVAAHHALSSLIVMVDANGQQALGFTKDVLHPGSPVDRWRAFGWDAIEVDGHDHEGLSAALTRATMLPSAVIAHTTFGKGISFMESRIAWHYLPMTDDQFALALAELSTA